MAYITTLPLDIASAIAAVSGPDRGGIACFAGAVRNQHEGRAVVRLEYAAYGPMAEAEAERIVAEAEATWPVRVWLQHRIGKLVIGDVAVVVAAAAAHRDAAFAACRYTIEEIKRRVPIWKREHYADGTIEWVDPTRSASAVPFPDDGASLDDGASSDDGE